MGQEISAIRRAAATDIRKLKSFLTHQPDAYEVPDPMAQSDFPRFAEVVAVDSTNCLDNDCVSIPGLDCEHCTFGSSNSEQPQGEPERLFRSWHAPQQQVH